MPRRLARLLRRRRRSSHPPRRLAALLLAVADRAVHDLTLYTAEPGIDDEDRLRLLASWAATQPGKSTGALERRQEAD
ncbi:hypothetical protein [Streptomyces sp. LARHCF252]